MSQMKIILASASPRRAEILSNAGIPFDVMTTQIDEFRRAEETAPDMVLRLARAKLGAAMTQLGTKSKTRQEPIQETIIVIAADTAVELDGEAFGKPGSALEARQMLERLSGRSHRVLTGIALARLPDGLSRYEVAATEVRFSALEAAEIERYVATSEPLDKAGGYAAQGAGGRFIERIAGCYFNVVGLPLSRVYQILKEFGWVPERGCGTPTSAAQAQKDH
jgi:nucleoside triphosphate pyrophosphatase